MYVYATRIHSMGSTFTMPSINHHLTDACITTKLTVVTVND